MYIMHLYKYEYTFLHLALLTLLQSANFVASAKRMCVCVSVCSTALLLIFHCLLLWYCWHCYCCICRLKQFTVCEKHLNANNRLSAIYLNTATVARDAAWH